MHPLGAPASRRPTTPASTTADDSSLFQSSLLLRYHHLVAEAGQVTLGQGARLAGLPLEAFIELLGQTDTPAVSYPREDLEGKVEAAR